MAVRARSGVLNHTRATGIAAFFLGVGLAGHPFDLLAALVAGGLILVMVLALERPGTPFKAFLVGLVGVLVVAALQHVTIGPSMHPQVFAYQLYFGLYPGSGVVGLGLGLLSAASFGRPHAPYAMAVIGTLVGVALFFLL